MNFLPVATFDHSEEQRKAVYQDLFDRGGFNFWLATYHDMLFSEVANDAAYDFWCVGSAFCFHSASN